MYEVTGKVQRYSKNTKGIKIDNTWYNLTKENEEFINNVDVGVPVSLVVDDDRNIVSAKLIGDEKNKDDGKQENDTSIDFRERQQTEIMKQVCLKCATQLTEKLIEVGNIESDKIIDTCLMFYDKMVEKLSK